MEMARRVLSDNLYLALHKRVVRHEPRFKPRPLLAHPHSCRRLRRVQRELLLPTAPFRERIPATTIITKPTVRMHNRSAALLALPNQRGAAPNTKILSLLRERVTTALWTNSIFVEWK